MLQAFRNQTSSRKESLLHENVKSITQEIKLIYEIKDIRDEIHLIRRIFEVQAEVLDQLTRRFWPGALKEAEAFARNAAQIQCLRDLADYLQSGDVLKQKEASISWLKDVAPPVETVVGFIEAYRDPLRREWMGLVAIQNKEETSTFNLLVDNAEKLIAEMPWNTDPLLIAQRPFENPVYSRPDFMSLENERLPTP